MRSPPTRSLNSNTASGGDAKPNVICSTRCAAEHSLNYYAVGLQLDGVDITINMVVESIVGVGLNACRTTVYIN